METAVNYSGNRLYVALLADGWVIEREVASDCPFYLFKERWRQE